MSNISAMICILFAEKYTYPIKIWWKMTTKAQFDPNIPWDKVIEKRVAALPANAAEGPSRRVASDGLSPDGNARMERKRHTRPVSMQVMSPSERPPGLDAFGGSRRAACPSPCTGLSSNHPGSLGCGRFPQRLRDRGGQAPALR